LSRSLRIVVAGRVAGEVAQGGATWALMQYVLGLEKLGHEVWLVEPTNRVATAQASYFRQVVERFRVRGTLVTMPQKIMGYDAVLNISGTLTADSISAVPIRVYLDLDPAFNQLWHSQGVGRGFEGHTHFVTVGQAVGTAACSVPTHGLEWCGTLPPVVLDHWRPADRIGIDALTTVANFRSYGSIDSDGIRYGQKAHSLRGLRDLPARSGDRFLLAMAIHPDDSRDRQALEGGGWELVDPDQVAATPDGYRYFVQASRAEIGIAKSGYVTSRCGWFSDRSACYLAAGRPVIAQDTGFSDFLPTGEGLMAFSDIDAAVEATQELRRDYSRHARAARMIAEEHLDSDRVLSRLISRVCA
jgi:hypothetical protein